MIYFKLGAVALAPGLAISVYFYLRDKHEREPILVLLSAFLFGALSVVMVIGFSYMLGSFVAEPKNMAIKAFLWVALVEELSKFLFLRYYAYPHREFNEPYDGIIYSVMIAMGFATLENILYVSNGDLKTGIMRMFTAVPAHAVFGVIMGYFAGLAKFAKRRRYLLMALGVMGAVVIHGAYDFFLFVSYQPGMVLGAGISLVLGIVLALRAVRIHQQNSPFDPSNHKEELPLPPGEDDNVL